MYPANGLHDPTAKPKQSSVAAAARRFAIMAVARLRLDRREGCGEFASVRPFRPFAQTFISRAVTPTFRFAAGREPGP